MKPTPRSRFPRHGLAALAIVLLLVGWWITSRVRDDSSRSSATATTPHRSVGPDFASALASSKARSARIPYTAKPASDGVTIAGSVLDARTAKPIPNVEVVFRSGAGEETTTASDSGTYTINVPPGMYRAFVRDDSVLSVGRVDLVRLPGMPSAETAGVPDEALMALVVARADTDNVDLSVTRGGSVSGKVVDRAGHPVAGVVLRARGRAGGRTLRPTLGTDVAETDEAGHYDLRLPEGEYEIEATHSRFAGLAQTSQIEVEAGGNITNDLTLTAGCVISGQVVGKDGKPSGDGAIERQWGSTDLEYAPTGRIEAGGAFRWVTTEEAEITLRAWPWKSPPSAGRPFACHEGARFDNVVFQIADRHPDIEGTLVDRSGAPVPFAFVDLQPLEPGGIGQQERADADGKWAVYSMPPGRYHVSAQADGRGVASADIESPRDGVQLVLGGIGRIEGTTTRLASGSFEVDLRGCFDGNAAVAVPHTGRLVTVKGGRFTIDDVPACDLVFTARWHGHGTQGRTTVPPDGTAHVELDVGPPHAKTVHGVVRDENGQGVPNALVSASFEDGDLTSLRADATGHYSLKTFAGASISAAIEGKMGTAAVGGANVDDEEVDIEIESVKDDELLE